MVQLRIALAQINPTVGDLEGNCGAIADYARRAADDGAHLAVFPEMAVTGYSVEDLALRNGFVAASIEAVHRLAERLAADGLGRLPVVVGFLDRRVGGSAPFGQPAGAPQNALALLHGGAVRLVSAKHHLPNYGVFDEFRYFVPGDTLPVVRLHGADIAFAVCEDLWQDGGPVAAVRAARAGMLITLNGSPYERGKGGVRLDLCRRRARETGAAIGYVNMTGGQDDLVFEGDSLVVDAHGELVSRAPRFEESLHTTDIELPEGPDEADLPGEAGGFRIVRHTVGGRPGAPAPARAPVLTPCPDPLNDTGEVYRALVAAVRDHVHKNGFASVAVGADGGAGAALTAAIAADAVGADRVHALVMPGPGAREEALNAAEKAAAAQGLAVRVRSVQGLVDAYGAAVGSSSDAAALGAQARGGLVAALSRQEGHLVLATGDKTALAIGAAALHGDHAGAFAPLRDCWRTLVEDLARWRNARAASEGAPDPVPAECLTPDGVPAAVDGGAADAAADADPRVLDALLEAYIGTDKGVHDLAADGFAPGLVRRAVRLVDRAEHRRRAYPPGPKITKRALGRDRRLPITSRWG
ncbi:nitrilase-related carbon-nitrogen hydrolase [Nocardiopsis suaedae]|uniref:Glutamine-dependent NAD(+) synthetase n=1 Tax=Nocardiopsis suaedae TaxID=3018444 RepID=A0ABT4TQU5_9ACTN|nr:nitrilase-related carbon-nitrogen hydrolase [Nocardiopsis suaedae]MDA2807059.1 NAD+ synthase [Nocardiopsis suaedae]